MDVKNDKRRIVFTTLPSIKCLTIKLQRSLFQFLIILANARVIIKNYIIVFVLFGKSIPIQQLVH